MYLGQFPKTLALRVISPMAISSLAHACKSHLSVRPSAYHCIRKVGYSIAAATQMLQDSLFCTSRGSVVGELLHDIKSKSKKLNADDLGINFTIDEPTEKVLDVLKKKGFEVYLVGECVQDFALKRTPKEYNIVTSAELIEVRSAFSQCEIVGQRFPICRVCLEDTIVKVSSFSTSARGFSTDFGCEFDRPNRRDDYSHYTQGSIYLQPDITINGLMFDPYAKIVYDYLEAFEHLRKAKVKFSEYISKISFVKDEVAFFATRILLVMRNLARGQTYCSREFVTEVKQESRSILRLNQMFPGKILTEMNYLLAYGSAEASLSLLWRFGLLEILLPFQAACLLNNGFQKPNLANGFWSEEIKNNNMLLCLFRHLDNLVAPDRPCHSSLWVAILAFHKAISDQPRDPLAVAAFSFAISRGGDFSEVENLLMEINYPHNSAFCELLEPRDLDFDTLKDEAIKLAASCKFALSQMSDWHLVSHALAEYPQAQSSNLVFISSPLYAKVCKIFECVRENADSERSVELHGKIDSELLALGSLYEVRRAFVSVVLTTVYGSYDGLCYIEETDSGLRF